MDPQKKQKSIVIFVIVAVVLVAACAGAVWYMKAHNGGAQAPNASSTVADVGPGSWEATCVYTSDLSLAEKDPMKVCSLDLSNQNLTAIPAQVFQMKNLEYLNLANNQITDVPADIGNLTHLQTLYLNQNKITALPSTLSQLTDLNFLSIEWDGVSSVSDTVANMKNLKALVLKGNPLSASEVLQVKSLFASASIIF